MTESLESWAGKVLYHGTDSGGAASILEGGPQIDRSSGGYFGRGFYLAVEQALAESNYADMNDEGVVLKCRLSAEARIWDLREPDAFAKWTALERSVRGGVANPLLPDMALRAGCDGVYDNSMQGVCIFNVACIASIEPAISMRDRIQVSLDGATVWVHGDDGSTVGRFSKRFGMDVHTTASAQLAGEPQCLSCTHDVAGQAEWSEFCRLMKMHHGFDIPEHLMPFEEPHTAAMPERP